MTAPDFSPLAERYAKSRPGYPPELFVYLASLVERREVAWDCATGNGQAALGLAAHFERVIATDVSAEQIRHAVANPRVEYRVAPSESSGLETDSVDLITVAAAVHWFDLEGFYAEAERVLRRRGVLAVWTYHIGYVEPPFDRVFHRFYHDVLRPFFAPKARLVDDRYRTLMLPGEPLDPEAPGETDAQGTPGAQGEPGSQGPPGARGEPGTQGRATGPFFVTADWNLDQMRAFIRSWSGAQAYLDDRGRDPIDTIAEELEAAWGDPSTIHRVRWPLFMRVSRVGS